jgi:arylsulfatase A-like enzyme
MNTTRRESVSGGEPSRVRFSSPAFLALAVSFGLCGGFLDLAIIVFNKYFLHKEGYFRTARDFPWTVPAGHVVLLLIAGLVVAALNLRGRGISVRVACWLFAALAIWCALLRAPLYGACSLVLAVGLGRLVGDAVAARGVQARRLGYVLAGLLGVLGVMAALSSGWQSFRENLAVARLPLPPSAARNVVLIVWDTVRASDLSSYGYDRKTTPNLQRLAEKGVQYNYAMAPAPWTYPTHTTLFTGQWPMKLNSQWKFKLDTADPTLAEYLASRGYQTAGFAANTNCCTYETGLARGFAHFEDYSLAPWSLLSRTVPGKWLLENLVVLGEMSGLRVGGSYDKKWITLQSAGANQISIRFFKWLSRRRSDRPFFAFLNYFDAHEPFVPSPDYEHQFGIRPESREDFQFLFDYVGAPKLRIGRRRLMMARDCYNDCIASLDDQLGRLLKELKDQGLLENTTVIITSDHGEGFGLHGIFGHSYTVNLEEIAVPLVILSPTAPAGRLVNNPVSLSDVPATIVDLLGLSAGSPFPGRSLTAYWGARAAGVDPQITTPAFSERADDTALTSHPTNTFSAGWFQMSMVASGKHYTRDALGQEQLYELGDDPLELIDLMKSPGGEQKVKNFRAMLLDVLSHNTASAEVESGYLKTFRDRLKASVQSSQGALPNSLSATGR